MKTRAKAVQSPDGQEQLKSFLDKFDPQNRALIRSVRTALRKRFPTANELVYDNYNFFVIGYSPTERPSDSIVSLAAGASGLGLCFPYCGARLSDPQSYCLAPEARIASSGLNRPRHWRVPRWKR